MIRRVRESVKPGKFLQQGDRSLWRRFIGHFRLMISGWSLLASFALAGDGPSSAQPDATIPASRSPQSHDKTGKLRLFGSLRLRAENWQWFETDAADSDYTFGASLFRLGLEQRKEKWDWHIEAAAPLLIGLPENAIAPAPQGQLGFGGSYFGANGRRDGSIFLKQAFVSLKGIAGRGSVLRAGRFEFVDGLETMPAEPTLATLKRDHIAHRLIGNFAFTHVGRSFDGLSFARDSKASNITLLAARPIEGSFQLRGWQDLEIDLFYGAYTRLIAGKRLQQEFRVMAMHYHDGRGIPKTDNRSLSVRQLDTLNLRLTTLGGHYLNSSKLGSGNMDVLFWGMGQFGDWGLLHHRAGAIAVEGGYQFPVRFNPWVRTGYFRGSGDGDAVDKRHTTFFQLLPTPRVYARFPFFNLMNNEDLFVQLRLKPHGQVFLRSDVRYLRLSSPGDLWYAGGGAFQKTTFGYAGRPSGGKKELGTLLDLSLDYNLTPKTVLGLYVSHAFGGRVIGNVYPQKGPHPGDGLFYVELTQRF